MRAMTIPVSFRSRAVLTSAGLYVIVSVVCTRIPLFDYLGFEFSVVIALVATVVGGVLSIGRIRAAYHRAGEESSAWRAETFRAFHEILSVNLVLLAIPLLIMALNALVVRNCSLLEGLAFFLLIPVVTVIFASALGFFCAVQFRFARTAFLAIAVATFGYALAVGYWTPAIFSYNFFYGFFPGLTYDEVLRLRWPMVTFRALTLFVALLLVLLARRIVRESRPDDSLRRKVIALLREIAGRRSRVYTAFTLVLLFGFYFYRCELGWESTSAYIQRTLGSSVVTEHVTIFYDSASFSPGEMRWIAAEHEFSLAQAWDAFVLPHRGRITSYIYTSAEAKQRLIGAGNTNIAKPWSREIHITRQSLDATLKHELMHVVVGVFGIPILRVSLSPGLLEGVPMALEGEWGTRTIHEYAAAIRRAGIVPDVKDLMTVYGFATHSSSVSYILVGSFCRYLIDRFGVRKLAQVYGHSNFEEVYGRSLDQLLADWGKYLERVAEVPGDEMLVDAFFRRPPIFGLVCARVLADRNERARALFAAKEYRQAGELFAASYAEGRRFEGLSGWLVSALRQGEYGVVSGVYDSVIVVDARPAEYLSLFILIGDAFWAQGDLGRAFALYDSVQRGNLSRGFTEAAICRALAMDHPYHEALLRFTLSDAHDSVRVRLLDSLATLLPRDFLIRYLRGKTLLRLERYEEALRALEGFDIGDTDARLESARRMAIGQALFRLRRFQEAKAAFWLSLNTAYTGGAKALVDEWIERCDWMSEHNP